MHATIRRYDGVDQNRTIELTSKVNETLVPKLSKLPGFAGYYLIEAGDGVFSSTRSLRDTGAEQGVVERRRDLDPRREARDGVPERAQDHERQGHRSQQRHHERVRLSRCFDEGPGLPGPSSFGQRRTCIVSGAV